MKSILFYFSPHEINLFVELYTVINYVTCNAIKLYRSQNSNDLLKSHSIFLNIIRDGLMALFIINQVLILINVSLKVQSSIHSYDHDETRAKVQKLVM